MVRYECVWCRVSRVVRRGRRLAPGVAILGKLCSALYVVGGYYAGGNGDRCVLQTVFCARWRLSDVFSASWHARGWRGRFDDDENVGSELRFDAYAGGSGAQSILAVVCGYAPGESERGYECASVRCRGCRAVALYRFCAGCIAGGARGSAGGFAFFKMFSRYGVGGDEFGFDGWEKQCFGHF